MAEAVSLSIVWLAGDVGLPGRVAALHTPSEMRRSSDLAHHAAGIALGLTAVLIGAETLGVVSRVWPLLPAGFGAIFLAFLFVHHGVEQIPRALSVFRSDRQQRDHLLLGLLLAAGGGGEIAGLGVAFPLALAAIGALFITHPQHGTHEAAALAARLHRQLGAALLAAAAVRAVALLAGEPAWLSLLWALSLLAAATLLVRYREAAGAYEPEMTAEHRGHATDGS